MKSELSALKTEYDSTLLELRTSLEDFKIKAYLELETSRRLVSAREADLLESITRADGLAYELSCERTQLLITRKSLESSESAVESLRRRVEARTEVAELDTFEQAMRNEMSTMKAAYEMKLGILNETMLEMRQRHKADMEQVQRLLRQPREKIP